MNKTYGDLMSEYQKHRENARRFDSWDELNAFAEELIQSVAPKVIKSTHKFKEFGFDDMGLAIPCEENE